MRAIRAEGRVRMSADGRIHVAGLGSSGEEW